MRKTAVFAIGILLVMGLMPLLSNNIPMASVIEIPYEFTISEAVEPPEGLVGWWPGDGNPYDYEGPNHGTLIGDTTFEAGMVGDAFSFDGDGDMVWATGHGINELQELTIETWLRHEAPLADEVNRYVTLGGEKAVLRYDYGELHFYMNLGGPYYSETSSLVIPDEGYNPLDGEPIDHSQFSFITVTGLLHADWISLSAEFTNADSDFMVWPGYMDPAEYSYTTDISNHQMVSLDSPETALIGWGGQYDSIVIGCFDYSLDPGEWTLNVDTFSLHHISVPDIIEAYRWHHVVGTYDGNFMRLYADGVEVGNHAFSGYVSPGDSVMFSADWGEDFNGLMDEISIYSRALSIEEIQTIYNAGVDGKLRPVDDYYVYSHYYQDVDYISSVGGWVADYGDPNVWGDEEQYLYYLSETIAYQVRVWLTDYEDEHPGEDTLSPGWIEPHQHPNNPSCTGPIEPRHFEVVSSVTLEEYTAGSRSHSDEFHVDERGIFLGAWPYGIYQFDHSWNDDNNDGYPDRPPELIANAPPVPQSNILERTETLAYDPDNDVWYAGARDLGDPTRNIWQASDLDSDGFYETWEVIFAYPSMNPLHTSEHHDGLDYAGGSIWISDMYSDKIAQWSKIDGVWVEENLFEYTEVGVVEGMGFGPNNHLWAASFWWTGDIAPNLYEFGGGNLQAEIPPYQVSIDIKPESWPNPINMENTGVLPVAICGTEDFDVTSIDPASVVIAFEGIAETVSPLRWSYEDVATPFIGDPYDGHEAGSDGFMDLVLHFDTPEIVETFRLQVHIGKCKPFFINANLKEEFGGREIQGKDYGFILGFFGDLQIMVRGHYYSAFYPNFNAPHYIKTGTWVTMGFGVSMTGATAELADQNLREYIDSVILGATMNGEPLDKIDSAYVWKSLDIHYDEANSEWVATVAYRYFINPQPAGTYEIYWSWYVTTSNILFERTGYLTWFEV
ncbi:MAG: LamG domain-containing protein [Candidatus Thorarchaeota archaeon]